MTTPHPLFVQLHAHLCGASELLRSGVSDDRVLRLYPFEIDAYRPFFTDYFKKHPEKLADPTAIATSYKLLNECLSPVEERISLGIYSEEQYDRQWEIATNEIPQAVDSLATEIAESNEFYTYATLALHHQLAFFARVMLLLSDWPAAEVEADEALNNTTRHNFFAGFEHLLAYYGVRIRFDTQQRRATTPQIRRLREQEAALTD